MLTRKCISAPPLLTDPVHKIPPECLVSSPSSAPPIPNTSIPVTNPSVIPARSTGLAFFAGGAFLGQLWLVASFSYYHSGASFGPRYFVSLLPFAAFGLSSAYDKLATPMCATTPL